jgi:hypothetical protein
MMRMNAKTKEDFEWGRQFIPGIKRAICNHTLIEAPADADQNEAADLMILDDRQLRYGFRMRRHTNLKKYGNQFTIRTARPSGSKTELAKILEGFLNRYIYGFAVAEGVGIDQWCLLDVDVFRRHYPYLAKKALHQKNGDGVTFDAWHLNDWPAEFLVDASWRHGPDKWVVRWEGQRALRL